LLEKVRALPGVQSVGIGSNSPLMGGWQTGFYREGIPIPTPSQMPDANLECVAGDYFATFKVPLQRGRTFNAGDTANSPRVIVIDQALAEQYFPGEDPLGKRLSVDVGNDNEGYAFAEIIGVVGRTRFHAFDETAPVPGSTCLFALGQGPRRSTNQFVTLSGRSILLSRSTTFVSCKIALRTRGALSVSSLFSFPSSPDSPLSLP